MHALHFTRNPLFVPWICPTRSVVSYSSWLTLPGGSWPAGRGSNLDTRRPLSEGVGLEKFQFKKKMSRDLTTNVPKRKKKKKTGTTSIEEEQLLSFHSPHFVLPGLRFQLPPFPSSRSVIRTSYVSFFRVRLLSFLSSAADAHTIPLCTCTCLYVVPFLDLPHMLRSSRLDLVHMLRLMCASSSIALNVSFLDVLLAKQVARTFFPPFFPDAALPPHSFYFALNLLPRMLLPKHLKWFHPNELQRIFLFSPFRFLPAFPA
jgi:hypothetical protein